MGGISRLTNGMVSFITVIQSISHSLALSLTNNKPALALSVPSQKELDIDKSTISLTLERTTPTLTLTVNRREILTITMCKKENN